MIPVTHSLVQDYLSAYRERPDAALAHIMLNDRLIELGGFPRIGEPGGLGLGDVCWWYARCRDEDEEALRMALVMVDKVLGNDKRAARVQEERIRRADLDRRIAQQPEFQYYIQQQALAINWYGSDVAISPDDPMWLRTKEKARAAAISDLKRRVLALYPEVRYKVSYRISDEKQLPRREPRDMEALMRMMGEAAGFLPHVSTSSRRDYENHYTEYWQKFTAACLILPDGFIDARWYSPLSTPLEDFRAAVQRIREDTGMVVGQPPFHHGEYPH